MTFHSYRLLLTFIFRKYLYALCMISTFGFFAIYTHTAVRTRAFVSGIDQTNINFSENFWC